MPSTKTFEEEEGTASSRLLKITEDGQQESMAKLAYTNSLLPPTRTSRKTFVGFNCIQKISLSPTQSCYSKKKICLFSLQEAPYKFHNSPLGNAFGAFVNSTSRCSWESERTWALTVVGPPQSKEGEALLTFCNMLNWERCKVVRRTLFNSSHGRAIYLLW